MSEDAEITHVFVYGTLKRGQCRERCWPYRPVSVNTATIRAALYNLGPYPAIGPGDALVLGEIWELHPDHIETTLAVLDNVEGYAGLPGDEYTRRVVTCTLLNGDEVEAFTYFYADVRQLRRYKAVPPDADGHHSWPSE